MYAKTIVKKPVSYKYYKIASESLLNKFFKYRSFHVSYSERACEQHQTQIWS